MGNLRLTGNKTIKLYSNISGLVGNCTDFHTRTHVHIYTIVIFIATPWNEMYMIIIIPILQIVKLSSTQAG